MHTVALSLNADTGGLSQKISVTTASSPSTALCTTPAHFAELGCTAIVTPDAAVFMRRGNPAAQGSSPSAPTAVNDGTDLYLVGGVSYRVQVPPNTILAFICASGTANVYITPEN